MKSWRGALFGLAVAALASPALAQPRLPLITEAPAPLTPAPETCPANRRAGDETADSAAVRAALLAFNSGGYSAFAAHLDTLRRVARRAPACYPTIELRNGEIIVRAEPEAFAEIAPTLLTGVERNAVQQAPNTYGDALFMLGSYYNEIGQYGEAERWLSRGARLQPHDYSFALERAMSHMSLRRYQDAADALHAALNDPYMARAADRAVLYRNLGVVMIDLERLEDAETVLRESIRLQPDNPIAYGELDYIRELRAGAARRPSELVPNEPQRTEPAL